MDTKLEEGISNETERTGGCPLTHAKFSLGRTLITPAALGKLHRDDTCIALGRHANGDWGICSPEDWRDNDFALSRPLRLLSSYRDRNGTKFWIITEADRSATTIMLPDDY